MFLRSAWYVAGWATEFEGGRLHARTIINEPIVLMRDADGILIALEDRCPHRWAPLSLGRIEDGTLRCMYHGIRFSTDGRCIEVPGQEKPSPGLRARAYPVVERHKWVWVWMGKADEADETLIPNASYLDLPDRYTFFGSLDYDADYRLINDNLLDLSHLAYVHAATIGRSASADGAPPPITNGAGAQSIERGVRNNSWKTGKMVVLPSDAEAGDLWAALDYMVPGLYIRRIAMFPPGTGEACGFGDPGDSVDALVDSFTCQAVTPMTPTSTRYFYSGGQRIGDGSPESAQQVFALVEQAFAEDKVMIEAQQRVISNHPGKRMGWINADRGLSLFRSTMERLIAEEQERNAAPAALVAG